MLLQQLQYNPGERTQTLLVQSEKDRDNTPWKKKAEASQRERATLVT